MRNSTMNMFLASSVIMIPVSVLLWKRDSDAKVRPALHLLLVLYGTSVTVGAYLELRLGVNRGLLLSEELWCSLPAVASVFVTGHCVICRLSLAVIRLARRRAPKALRQGQCLRRAADS
jgi:hypothetical protein